MNIAILTCSDFLIIGGAERFIIDIATALDATIVTIGSKENINLPYDIHNVKFHCLNIKLPSEPLRQVIGINLFRKLKLNYDYYISVDDMSMYNLKNKPHLYYIFTPRRAFYDMYYDTMSTKHGLKSLVYSIGIWLFRLADQRYVHNNINHVACISNNVRNRIRKTYLRDAYVIYPCVHTEKYSYGSPGDYWLSVNRVDKWKQVDLQVEAFRHMPDKQLVIVGSVYEDMQTIVDAAPDNVHFIGIASESKLQHLYSHCIGFITTAIDEDFGITPLEAMASGKPVIATKEGGYMETVIDGYTGRLCTPCVDEIVQAVIEISKHPEQYKDACIKQAQKFDYSIFKVKIRECTL